MRLNDGGALEVMLHGFANETGRQAKKRRRPANEQLLGRIQPTSAPLGGALGPFGLLGFGHMCMSKGIMH